MKVRAGGAITERAERRPCVLVVDDKPDNVLMLAEMLRKEYQVVSAEDGARAIELARSGEVDLVLLDVVMPGMDGLAVCRSLKSNERTRRIPVIFVTALGEVKDETSGFEAGGVDYITKPITPAVVQARVRTHLGLKAAQDRLAALASVDALTGIANRRRFDSCLLEEWRRAIRSGHWLSLALLDIDHFKDFNDRHGHAQGDECLRQVARALAASCRRPADLAARYGGEEFALVLPETDSAGACSRVAAALARVHALKTGSRGVPLPARVTLSAGVVSLRPSAKDHLGPTLEQVDRLLYEAKQGGREHGVHLDLVTGTKGRIVPG
jgi:diguanylate cyclase (GGDEF)-like protein